MKKIRKQSSLDDYKKGCVNRNYDAALFMSEYVRCKEMQDVDDKAEWLTKVRGNQPL